MDDRRRQDSIPLMDRLDGVSKSMLAVNPVKPKTATPKKDKYAKALEKAEYESKVDRLELALKRYKRKIAEVSEKYNKGKATKDDYEKVADEVTEEAETYMNFAIKPKDVLRLNKKYPDIFDDEIIAEAEGKAKLEKRGRPKKVAVEAPKEKKKRGRPKKVAPAAEPLKAVAPALESIEETVGEKEKSNGFVTAKTDTIKMKKKRLPANAAELVFTNPDIMKQISQFRRPATIENVIQDLLQDPIPRKQYLYDLHNIDKLEWNEEIDLTRRDKYKYVWTEYAKQLRDLRETVLRVEKNKSDPQFDFSLFKSRWNSAFEEFINKEMKYFINYVSSKGVSIIYDKEELNLHLDILVQVAKIRIRQIKTLPAKKYEKLALYISNYVIGVSGSWSGIGHAEKLEDLLKKEYTIVSSEDQDNLIDLVRTLTKLRRKSNPEFLDTDFWGDAKDGLRHDILVEERIRQIPLFNLYQDYTLEDDWAVDAQLSYFCGVAPDKPKEIKKPSKNTVVLSEEEYPRKQTKNDTEMYSLNQAYRIREQYYNTNVERKITERYFNPIRNLFSAPTDDKVWREKVRKVSNSISNILTKDRGVISGKSMDYPALRSLILGGYINMDILENYFGLYNIGDANEPKLFFAGFKP